MAERYNPGIVNRILGRKLECGKHPWYDLRHKNYDWFWYKIDQFRFHVLRHQWSYSLWDEADQVEDHYWLLSEKDALARAKIAWEIYPNAEVTITRSLTP